MEFNNKKDRDKRIVKERGNMLLCKSPSLMIRTLLTLLLGIVMGFILSIIMSNPNESKDSYDKKLKELEAVAMPKKIISKLLRLSGYKPPAADRVSPFFAIGPVPGFDTIIDVGGFDCWDYTIPGFKTGYTVYTFELDKRNQERCIGSLKFSNLVEGLNYTIINVTHGKLPAQIKSPKRPHIYFFKAGASNKVSGVSITEIEEMARANGEGDTPIVPLDYIIPTSAKILIFKSDTQGHEYGVFSGAQEILKRGAEVLLLEFWPEGAVKQGFNATQLLELLYGLNYQCFDAAFSLYNKLDRPSDIYAFSNRFLNAGHTEDIIGSWDDLVCTRFT